MFRGHFLRMVSHAIQSINMPFNIVVVVLCVGAGFGIAVISGILQGDPMQRGTKQPAGGIFGAAGLALEQGELATQAFQYMSAAGDPQKQDEIKKKITAQYDQMDEKRKEQLKNYMNDQHPEKAREIKKQIGQEGLP